MRSMGGATSLAEVRLQLRLPISAKPSAAQISVLASSVFPICFRPSTLARPRDYRRSSARNMDGFT